MSEIVKCGVLAQEELFQKQNRFNSSLERRGIVSKTKPIQFFFGGMIAVWIVGTGTFVIRNKTIRNEEDLQEENRQKGSVYVRMKGKGAFRSSTTTAEIIWEHAGNIKMTLSIIVHMFYFVKQ